MFSSRRPLVQSSKECGRPSLSGWTYPWKKYNPMTNNDNTMTTITNNGKQWQRNENKMTTQWQNNDNAMPNNVRDKSLSLRQDLADAIPVLKQESHYAIYEAYSVVQVESLFWKSLIYFNNKRVWKPLCNLWGILCRPGMPFVSYICRYDLATSDINLRQKIKIKMQRCAQ